MNASRFIQPGSCLCPTLLLLCFFLCFSSQPTILPRNRVRASGLRPRCLVPVHTQMPTRCEFRVPMLNFLRFGLVSLRRSPASRAARARARPARHGRGHGESSRSAFRPPPFALLFSAAVDLARHAPPVTRRQVCARPRGPFRPECGWRPRSRPWCSSRRWFPPTLSPSRRVSPGPGPARCWQGARAHVCVAFACAVGGYCDLRDAARAEAETQLLCPRYQDGGSPPLRRVAGNGAWGKVHGACGRSAGRCLRGRLGAACG